jgi:hypothetical protein
LKWIQVAGSAVFFINLEHIEAVGVLPSKNGGWIVRAYSAGVSSQGPGEWYDVAEYDTVERAEEIAESLAQPLVQRL